MTMKRIIVDKNDFETGTSAYFTKCFVTYRVKFVRNANEKVLVEITEMVLVHEKALKEYGFRHFTRPFEVGTRLKARPDKLWAIETIKEPSLFQRLRGWFGKGKTEEDVASRKTS